MSMNLAAASAASAAPIAYRNDAADVGFPWAGAALLTLLAIIAIAARWQSQRRSRPAAGGWLSRWLRSLGDVGLPEGGLSVGTSVRLDGQTQLHSVRWGQRELLVATSLNASPVLLESRDAADAGKRS